MATFDPEQHMSKVGNADYLEVKWRLVWLRDTHPDAVIETEAISISERLAVFKATVTLANGARATGHGSEDPQGFREYIEKAETKAVGRALGMLGFGTQFCGDELDEGVRPDGRAALSDSPVQRPGKVVSFVNNPTSHAEADRLAAADNHRTHSVNPPTIRNPDEPASEAQIRMIMGRAKAAGFTTDGKLDTDKLYAAVLAAFNADLDKLSKGQASQVIDALGNGRLVMPEEIPVPF